MAEKREIGRTGVRVPEIGFGTAGIGDMPETFGYGVDEARALATVRTILDVPGAFVDTARNYGMGRGEERIGKVVRELGGLPEGRVLCTKLDRDAQTGRFDAAQARRSLEESLEALGRGPGGHPAPARSRAFRARWTRSPGRTARWRSFSA